MGNKNQKPDKTQSENQMTPAQANDEAPIPNPSVTPEKPSSGTQVRMQVVNDQQDLSGDENFKYRTDRSGGEPKAVRQQKLPDGKGTIEICDY